MKMTAQHREFLFKMRETGKGEHFRVTRQRILDEMSGYMWRSYCAGCLTYKEYKECVVHLRESLKWEALIGVKQTSIFDLLSDEDLVATMEEKPEDGMTTSQRL